MIAVAGGHKWAIVEYATQSICSGPYDPEENDWMEGGVLTHPYLSRQNRPS